MQARSLLTPDDISMWLIWSFRVSNELHKKAAVVSTAAIYPDELIGCRNLPSDLNDYLSRQK